MFSKETCLLSLTTNGCRKIGRNRWTDGEYNFRLSGNHNGYELIAERLTPTVNTNEAIRAALRPMFLAARAAGRV